MPMIATGPCVVCGTVFTFNAERVPSYDGRPICLDCVTQANRLRAEDNLPPIVIYNDSYGAGE